MFGITFGKHSAAGRVASGAGVSRYSPRDRITHPRDIFKMPKESIDTLVSELTHEEEWRRMRATAACLAGGPRAVQALIAGLADRGCPLRAEAAAMLSRIKDPAAGLALVGLIRDPEETVRQAAFAALEQMAGNLDDETAAGSGAQSPRVRPTKMCGTGVRQLWA